MTCPSLDECSVKQTMGMVSITTMHEASSAHHKMCETWIDLSHCKVRPRAVVHSKTVRSILVSDAGKDSSNTAHDIVANRSLAARSGAPALMSCSALRTAHNMQAAVATIIPKTTSITNGERKDVLKNMYIKSPTSVMSTAFQHTNTVDAWPPLNPTTQFQGVKVEKKSNAKLQIRKAAVCARQSTLCLSTLGLRNKLPLPNTIRQLCNALW
mmetsp:Transcript_121250/g.304866  ORF Transcript_121250/g.304866 Transcript_121250/m.304866 type:complete len:212 (+) Transcript_121250:812-1447(+)